MNLNNKSKKEQIFILFLLCIGVFGGLCLSGCGSGKSCETVDCTNQTQDDITIIGISIPGCGGCLTSGDGCGCPLWAQSCKFSTICYPSSEASNDEEESAGMEQEKDKKKTDKLLQKQVNCITGCDTRYYNHGCLGCGQQEKSCYNGCINVEENVGCFYGSTGDSSDTKERMIGCANGCGGCYGTDGSYRDLLDLYQLF